MRNFLIALCFVAASASPVLCATARDKMIDDCDSKNPDVAIPACKALIASGTETRTGLVVTHTQLGAAYFGKQTWTQAIQEFDLAIILDADGSQKYRTYLWRGSAYSANCQLDAAIEDANRAMALKPTEATPYFNRGRVWLRKGDAVRARADFAQAHRMKPDDFPTPEKAFAQPRPPACAKPAPKRG